jgi:hypothetical protein
VPAAQRTTIMDALTANAQNVVRTVCDVRGFCGLRRTPFFPLVFGNDPAQQSSSSRLHSYMSIADEDIMSGAGDPSGPFNDVVAHEHGHLIDYDYAGDRVIRGLNLEGRSVEEALADMFAFDYDRSDPTIGEESPAGAGRDWANPGSITRGGQPYPAHMDDYDRTPPAADDGEPSEHFNSTILSHAYYLFVQAVGSDKAGRVLHSVPQRLSPAPHVRRACGARSTTAPACSTAPPWRFLPSRRSDRSGSNHHPMRNPTAAPKPADHRRARSARPRRAPTRSLAPGRPPASKPPGSVVSDVSQPVAPTHAAVEEVG